jgi:hypothetical protein
MSRRQSALVAFPRRRALVKDLRRRLVPNPERRGTVATTPPATPAPLPFVDVQVLGGERMPFLARLGYIDFGPDCGVEQLVGVAEAHDTS